MLSRRMVQGVVVALVGVAALAPGAQAQGATPAVQASDITLREPARGSRLASFELRLSRAHDVPLSVRVQTESGSARAGRRACRLVQPPFPAAVSRRAMAGCADFRSRGTRVTFPAGTRSRLVGIRVFRDSLDEPTERFHLRISALREVRGGRLVLPSGAPRQDRVRATARILDTDRAPALSIADVSSHERDLTATSETTQRMTFRVSVAGLSVRSGSVGWRVECLDACPTVVAPAPGSRIRVPAGAAVVPIDVTIRRDPEAHATQHFRVRLFAPRTLRLRDRTATGTLIDEGDALPTVHAGDTLVAESTGAQTIARVPVTLGSRNEQPVTITWHTERGSAQDPDDYLAGNGSLTLPPHTTSGVIEIPITGDSDVEGDETFSVVLDSATNATLFDPVGVVTIRSDDVPG